MDTAQAVNIAKAALAGTRGLDGERARRTLTWVLAFVDEAARGGCPIDQRRHDDDVLGDRPSHRGT
jgi:hypothetical protein